jgi:hypothetical protein
MHQHVFKPGRHWILTLCLCLPFQRLAAQSVELTAEIETAYWNAYGKTPPEVRTSIRTAHCVVTTNSWLITECGPDTPGVNTWCFAGSNIFTEYVTTKPVSDYKELYERNHGPMPPIGERTTNIIDSVDGNPGGPIRLQHPTPLLGFKDLDTAGRICWLAFCSGPALKRDSHGLMPPDKGWRFMAKAPPVFVHKTTVFDDELALPNSVTLYVTNQQPILQYRATLTTNVLGWEFPLEFYLAQYSLVAKDEWALALTAKGKLTSIGPGPKPQLLLPTSAPDKN